MNNNNFDIQHVQEELFNKSPQEIIKYALRTFDSIAISFSGAEDVVLIDMASKITSNFNVFSIDTGRLHSETYQFFEEVRNYYGFNHSIVFPEASDVEKLVNNKGFYSFYNDGHKECCSVRKVNPLIRKLETLDAWITGQRKDQNPSTRSDLPNVQLDVVFSTSRDTLVKFNPLSNWTSDKVWKYIQINKVPYNKLHENGFPSIGCQPCTKAVLPNQSERLGRWWWEDSTLKECGFHDINAISK
jgi:phosphoadenosine phosphosulfate reductase